MSEDDFTFVREPEWVMALRDRLGSLVRKRQAAEAKRDKAQVEIDRLVPREEKLREKIRSWQDTNVTSA